VGPWFDSAGGGAAMKSKQSAALAKIRQACCLGLPSRVFMPMVAAQLRAEIPSACCQFTWSSQAGRICNFWSDTFMPRRMAWIILHHKRYEADAGVGFRDLVLFGAPTGNMRAIWGRGFEQSATYAAVFEPYGFKWFLDGVVRDAARPYGALALIRRHDQPDFSAGEEELLARALPYVAHAMRIEACAPSRFVRGGRSALIVCDAQGEVVEWPERAQQLALLALVDAFDLDTTIEGAEFAEARRALREIAALLHSRLGDDDAPDAMPTLVRRNGWGEFVFRGYQLAPQRIGVLIEQSVPLEAHLLERVNATALSTRQKEVALLSAKGLPNAQIAQQLNLAPQTVKDYFKDIYSRLEINSREELVQRLSDEAPRRWPERRAHITPHGGVRKRASLPTLQS
jgi:DNA-binding CsgD family transcriptional regulator